MQDVTSSAAPQHAVITGASSGIGQAAAVALAQRGWRVTLVGRDHDRLASALQRVRQAAVAAEPVGVTADFASFAEVRELAAQLAGQHIDVLANNAGLIARGVTGDGYDRTMQVNHMSPFLLTHLLRDQLRPGGRIITTSSQAHAWGGDPTRLAHRFRSVWLAYGASKRANIMFAAEAARRWPQLHSYSFHPGVVRTRFGTPGARLFYRAAPGLATPEQSAEQLVWLATTDPADLTNGGYYESRKLTVPHRSCRDAAVAAQLWDATAALVLARDH